MSLTRFTPFVARAFRLPMERPKPFLRCVTPWLLLAVASQFLAISPMPSAALIAYGLDALALAGFAVAWSRAVAFDESSPGLGLGLERIIRIVLFMIAFQVAAMVETFPLPFLRMALSGLRDGEILSQAGVQLFQMLIGGFLLVLPHIALAKPSEAGGTRLQHMVLAGGLAVGLGYVLGGMPFLIMTLMWADIVPTLPQGTITIIGAGIVSTLISFAALAVSAGFFAQIWIELKDVNPFAPAAEDTAPTEPQRPRRTDRLTKKTKIKR